jgi:hypothetical protein
MLLSPANGDQQAALIKFGVVALSSSGDPEMGDKQCATKGLFIDPRDGRDDSWHIGLLGLGVRRGDDSCSPAFAKRRP